MSAKKKEKKKKKKKKKKKAEAAAPDKTTAPVPTQTDAAASTRRCTITHRVLKVCRHAHAQLQALGISAKCGCCSLPTFHKRLRGEVHV